MNALSRQLGKTVSTPAHVDIYGHFLDVKDIEIWNSLASILLSNISAAHILRLKQNTQEYLPCLMTNRLIACILQLVYYGEASRMHPHRHKQQQGIR